MRDNPDSSSVSFMNRTERAITAPVAKRFSCGDSGGKDLHN